MNNITTKMLNIPTIQMINEEMCKEAFMESHPYESPVNAEECDNGSWECINCPWRDK